MYDLHCHLPFGISDGPSEREDSEKILATAAASGVTFINAVAHYAPGLDEPLEAAVAALRPRAAELGIALHAGYEFTYADLISDGFVSRPVSDESSFILVDFDGHSVPDYAERRFYDLATAGNKVLVVHPEVLFAADQLPKLMKLLKGGAFFQLNASSFAPESARQMTKLGHLLIRLGLAHCVASDTHRCEGKRRMALTEARAAIKERHGGRIAKLLFDTNPERIAKGLPPYDLPVKPLSWLEKWRYHLK